MQNGLKAPEIRPSGLSDSDLAVWLDSRLSTETPVAYVHAKHIFKVFESGSESSTLLLGDLGSESARVLKTMAKKRILERLELPIEVLEGSTFPASDWTLLEATVKDVTALKTVRDKIFGQGRGKALSAVTAAKVWHDAGGRCMYRGCGLDLGVTPLTTKNARIAYLAHIVASDPDGPRGDSSSHTLSDNPENIMLMCDAHHRLIDRIDVAAHSVGILQSMRDEHTARVNMLLDGLKFPSVQLITLLADLGQVPTNISKTELCDAALSRNLGPLPEIKHMLRRTQRDDRGRTGFWKHFLHEHDSDIRELISYTGNRTHQKSSVGSDALGVFPLHLVPVLVLAGRIIGEARHVEVFQYDRHIESWRWPQSPANLASEFEIHYELSGAGDVEESILSIELTADLDTNALPEDLTQAIQEKRVGWIRIKSDTPCANCINSNDQLDNFSNLARQALQTIQDSWRSKVIHVFGISPASTLFKFGQMLQAGNHSICRVYDRPNGSTCFVPALDITGSEVISIGSLNEQQHTISLR